MEFLAFEILKEYDVRHQLQIIKIPTLVACGEQDIILSLKLSRELSDNIPDATLETFSASADFPYVEQNTLLLDKIHESLERAG